MREKLVGGGLAGHRRRAFTESVLEFTWDGLEVLHTASARRTTTQSLLRPVVLAHLSGWVPTRGARGLLHVVRTASTPTADRVRLVVALTETLRTFRHFRWDSTAGKEVSH